MGRQDRDDSIIPRVLGRALPTWIGSFLTRVALGLTPAHIADLTTLSPQGAPGCFA
jgi:hypothetical protein